MIQDNESKIANYNIPVIDRKTRFDFIAENNLFLAHLFSALLLLVLLIIGGTVKEKSTTDITEKMSHCLNKSSWARNATRTVHMNLSSFDGNCDTFESIETIWRMLVKTLQSNSQRKDKDGAVWLGYATGQAQFFAITNCDSAQYILHAISFAVFGDNIQRNYAFIDEKNKVEHKNNRKSEKETHGAPEVPTAGGQFQLINFNNHKKKTDPRTAPWYGFANMGSANGSWVFLSITSTMSIIYSFLITSTMSIIYSFLVSFWHSFILFFIYCLKCEVLTKINLPERIFFLLVLRLKMV